MVVTTCLVMPTTSFCVLTEKKIQHVVGLNSCPHPHYPCTDPLHHCVASNYSQQLVYKMASVKRFPFFQFPKIWNEASIVKRNPSKIAFLKSVKYALLNEIEN